ACALPIWLEPPHGLLEQRPGAVGLLHALAGAGRPVREGGRVRAARALPGRLLPQLGRAGLARAPVLPPGQVPRRAVDVAAVRVLAQQPLEVGRGLAVASVL